MISGNNANGMLLQANAWGTLIQGNSIGLNAAGTGALAKRR